MTEANDFQWPHDPPQDWWQVTGASLGMSDELIRFAAALFSVGGADARKNSVAAKLAGIQCGRTQAFRFARSVAVRKILDHAEQIKTGKRKPLTKEEIRFKIEDLVRSADAATAARGIELLAKFEERERAANKEEGSGDPKHAIAYIENEFGELVSALLSLKYDTSPTPGAIACLDSFCPHCRSLLTDSIPNRGFPSFAGSRATNGHADESETANAA